MPDTKTRPAMITAEWIKFWWPMAAALVAFSVAWGEMRVQIGHQTKLLNESVETSKKVAVIDTVITSHLQVPAHGKAALRLATAEREIAVLGAQMSTILQRLESIDRKLDRDARRAR